MPFRPGVPPALLLLSIITFFVFSPLRCVACPPSERGDISCHSKNQYSLFNRAPDNLLRDLATDRPDKTESPYTLDAGHFMHETDVVNYTINQDEGLRDETLLIIAPNLKLGLTNNIDLQVMYQVYQYQRQRVITSRESNKVVGSGDLIVRLKKNLWGNDEGDSAAAVMPYITFPVGEREPGSDRYLEGGLIAPFAISLGQYWGLGLMTQIDLLREHGTDSKYHAQWVNSASLSRSISGPLSGYLEVFLATSRLNAPIITIDSGLTVTITRNLQLDVGMNVGLTAEADDLNPFFGISQRF